MKLRPAFLVFTLVLISMLLFPSPVESAPPLPVRRVAVIVGANDPAPGRSPLRFAHEDARRMADVLVRVGHFARGDVHVLLEPTGAELLAILEKATQSIRSAGGETLFLFYYSGHSDGQAVYPHGEAVSIADLRERISRIGARIKVGLLDACRGGSWTQAKGLTVGPALSPMDLLNVAIEGTALVSSSSGFENAHEADAVRGSFFTHYFAAGLLGAADRTGDGSITLQEAFDYAKERTVRDSARLAPTMQHPSFDLKLRGRQDIVLAQVASIASALEVTQTAGPIEVIHLDSGVSVAETLPGQRTLRIALVPGRYLVRRVENGRTYVKEIEVPAGAQATLVEGQLEAVGAERLSLKGHDAAPLPISARSSIPRRTFEIRVATGVSNKPVSALSRGVLGANSDRDVVTRDVAASGSISFGLTDRLTWYLPMPAFSYRFGDPGRFEVVPRVGLTGFGYSSIMGVIATVDAGVAMRVWGSPRHTFLANVAAGRSFASGPIAQRWPWDVSAAIGFGGTLRDVVTMQFGVGMDIRVKQDTVPDGQENLMETWFTVGSIQSIGYRLIPFVQVHASPTFSFDAYVSWSMNLKDRSLRDRYLVGFSKVF